MEMNVRGLTLYFGLFRPTNKKRIKKKQKAKAKTCLSIDNENGTWKMKENSEKGKKKYWKREGEILMLHFHLIVFPVGGEAIKIENDTFVGVDEMRWSQVVRTLPRLSSVSLIRRKINGFSDNGMNVAIDSMGRQDDTRRKTRLGTFQYYIMARNEENERREEMNKEKDANLIAKLSDC